MKIKRYNDFTLTESMVEYFINSFEIIKESDETQDTDYKKILKKIVSDLKLNLRLVSTFGFGIGAFLPIIHSLMKNANLSQVELTKETMVLLVLTSLSIIYLEEKNTKSAEEESELTKDSKSMLEELRMKGIGDGIVRKVIKCLNSTTNIFSIIGKHIGAVIGGLMDMFAYGAILVPITNGLSNVINKFHLNLDTMPENFLMLSAGVATIIAKHGIALIINKLKSKIKLPKKVEDRIEDEIEEMEEPTIMKTFKGGNLGSDIINDNKNK
jgi:hypothetical protein